jgi:hypothetical protein
MTEPGSIFRREAIEFQSGTRAKTSRLEVDRRGDRWLSWLLVLLFVAGGVMGFVIRVDETTSGPAMIDASRGTFQALLPDAGLGDMASPLPVRLTMDGSRQRGTFTGSATSSATTDESGARDAGLPAPEQASRLVSGTFAPIDGGTSAGPLPGRAVVVLRSDRAVTVFIRQVVDLSGRGSGS